MILKEVYEISEINKKKTEDRQVKRSRGLSDDLTRTSIQLRSASI